MSGGTQGEELRLELTRQLVALVGDEGPRGVLWTDGEVFADELVAGVGARAGAVLQSASRSEGDVVRVSVGDTVVRVEARERSALTRVFRGRNTACDTSRSAFARRSVRVFICHSRPSKLQVSVTTFKYSHAVSRSRN